MAGHGLSVMGELSGVHGFERIDGVATHAKITNLPVNAVDGAYFNLKVRLKRVLKSLGSGVFVWIDMRS